MDNNEQIISLLNESTVDDKWNSQFDQTSPLSTSPDSGTNGQLSPPSTLIQEESRRDVLVNTRQQESVQVYSGKCNNFALCSVLNKNKNSFFL